MKLFITSTVTAETLTEARIICAFEEKDIYLYYFIYLHKGRTLIFCNSISCVRRLAQLLTLLQCRPLPFHANMKQRQRLKNLDRFREDPCGLLLATDVAARGLDIPDVQHVVHYQVPCTSEVSKKFKHRHSVHLCQLNAVIHIGSPELGKQCKNRCEVEENTGTVIFTYGFLDAHTHRSIWCDWIVSRPNLFRCNHSDICILTSIVLFKVVILGLRTGN